MSNSYRIRTQVGVDKAVNVLLEQDFESLEILSLKILQSQIYTRQCSDYGVIVGRISANNGFGLPNVKVSVFIPLSTEDEENPVISELYPYKTLNDLNDDGYRYNLLPYEMSHGGHTPTGTFPTRKDVLTNPTLVEVFDKYYKYTAKTNDSGDFMIFGVPVGPQTLHIDVDLSDIGEFSLTPQDLIRLNLATENQVDGTKFKSSTNLGELPQIKQANRTVEVVPLWGQPEICYLGITRVDFDLSQEFGIKIEPSSVFMGSIFSNVDEKFIKRNCKTNKKIGNFCSLVAGAGQILAIRQTIQLDYLGRPLLEKFSLENGGNCIDDDGTWLIDLPMNLDYIYTSESGERLISTDPSVGIPTKARYRFKIKWQQPPTITGKILRGSYLVPNIKEWGWTGTTEQDPTVDPPSGFGEVVFGVCKPPDSGFTTSEPYTWAKASYAFSVDWDDYGAGPYKDIMINEAIRCEDRFFEFRHSKVYTVSSLITEFRAASNADYRYLAIKDILNSECESTTNLFPANDGQKNNDIIYTLFTFFLGLLTPILFNVIWILHQIALLLCMLSWLVGAVKVVICGIANALNQLGDIPLLGLPFKLLAIPFEILCGPIQTAYDYLSDKCGTFGLQLPVFVYPDCEFCQCENLSADPQPTNLDELGVPGLTEALQNAGGTTILQDFHSPTNWQCNRVPQYWLTHELELVETPVKDENISNYIGALQTGGPALSGGGVHCPLQQNIVVDDNNADGGIGTGNRDNVDAWKMFTTSLPFFERFNLLNTKSKYFSPTAFNPGSGRNRIRVKFASDNAGNTEYHQDNVIILCVKPNQLSNFQSGKIFTSVKKDMSQDPNLSLPNFTGTTEFGNNAVTGVTLGTPVFDSNGVLSYFERNVSVYYANPNGSGNQGPVNYTITASTSSFGDEKNYYKFPSDIEYFQVLTGLTVADYVSLSNPLGTDETLRSRILGSYMDIVHDLWDDAPDILGDTANSTSLYYDPDTSNSPFSLGDASNNPTRWNCQKDAQEIGIIFLVRGVDPYSSRQTCSYDLSLLFGYETWLVPGLTVEGQFKLNIPIQGDLRNVRHGSPSVMSNSSIDSAYSQTYLFYPSYSFSPDNSMYQQYTTTATSFYIKGDFEDVGGIPNIVGGPAPAGLRVNDSNWFTREFWSRWTGLDGQIFNPTFPGPNGRFLLGCKSICPDGNNDWNNNDSFNQPTNSRNRGYFRNEVVEGAGIMYLDASQYQPQHTLVGTICSAGDINSNYISYSYKSYYTNTSNYTVTMSSSQRIVMRADRLMTSSSEQSNGNYSYALHANQNFNLFEVDDEGYVQSNGVGEVLVTDSDVSSNPTLSGANNTFGCEGLIPLACYSTDPETGNVIVLPPTDDCYKNSFGEEYVRNGCYVLIQTPILSLLKDFQLLAEWSARTKIGFAACRNIFGLIFTNYWVNGTLYMFPIKNSVKYTGPLDVPPNSPYPCICPDVVFADYTTNNMYYRSAPYKYGVGFVGKNSPTNFTSSTAEDKPNYKNILYPTTIMDLGPRTKYTTELVLSDEYLGYVMDRLSTTSYQDTSDLLNQFILSRLTSQSLIGMIITQLVPVLSTAGDPVRRMFSRGYNKIDGDYAQMVAINSQIGVFPYDEDEYLTAQPNAVPSAPNGYVYTNPSSSKYNVFGIFYQQNYQLRDWLSPHRLVNSPSGSTTNVCTYENLPIFTQTVPFYQWYIQPNRGSSEGETPDPDSIFGDQRNDWWTPNFNAGTTDVFYASPYQGMDRLNSLFMQPNDTSIYGFHGGYLYNVTSGQISAYPANPNGMPVEDVTFNPDGLAPKETFKARIMTPSGPYYFYFGLNKGKSAFDKFLTKWVQNDDVFEI